MKHTFLIFLFCIASGLATYSGTLFYFQWRTGYPLLEVFEVKDRCQKAYHGGCTMFYYMYPDSALKIIPFENPKTHAI